MFPRRSIIVFDICQIFSKSPARSGANMLTRPLTSGVDCSASRTSERRRRRFQQRTRSFIHHLSSWRQIKNASWIILLDLNRLDIRSDYNVRFTAFLEHLVTSLLLLGQTGSSPAAELSTWPTTDGFMPRLKMRGRLCSHRSPALLQARGVE